MFSIEFPATVDEAEVKSALDAFLTRIGAKPSPADTEYVTITIDGLAKFHRLSVDIVYCPALKETKHAFRGPNRDTPPAES